MLLTGKHFSKWHNLGSVWSSFGLKFSLPSFPKQWIRVQSVLIFSTFEIQRDLFTEEINHSKSDNNNWKNRVFFKHWIVLNGLRWNCFSVKLYAHNIKIKLTRSNESYREFDFAKVSREHQKSTMTVILPSKAAYPVPFQNASRLYVRNLYWNVS